LADLGAGTLSSVGGSDIFIAKYTSQNSLLWAKRFGSGGNDNAYSVAVDSQNNIIVVGPLLTSWTSLAVTDPTTMILFWLSTATE